MGGLIFIGVFAVLLASGWIFPEIGGSYSYPRAAVRLAKPAAVKQLVRLGFWTSGFV